MLALLKKLWSRLSGHLPDDDVSDEGPLTVLESSEPTIHYLLPLRWSLHYALSEKQWNNMRQRHRELFPNSGRCSCPKRCKANTLDETWRYDHSTHTKVFRGAQFICPGCHWLKTPPWRIQTWLEQRDGLLPALTKAPHVIECLGWTQQRVDALRNSDLERHRAESIVLARLGQQVQQGKAAIIPAPPERLSTLELEKHFRPGQVMVVPWRVDLSALMSYGYSNSEIAVFVERMYKLAAKRMTQDNHNAQCRQR
jgi:hypothetical protein